MRSSHVVLALRCLCFTSLLTAAWAQGVRVSERFPSSASGDVDAFVLTPDGSQVLYLADQEIEDVAELFRAPVDGGSASVRASGALLAGGRVRAFTWSESHETRPIVVSPLGDQLVYLTADEVEDRLRLYSAYVDGSGSPVLLHQGFNTFSEFEARIAPAQQRVVYRAAVSGGSGQQRLFSAPLDGSAAFTQLSAPIGTRSVRLFFLSPDGALAYYLSEDTAATAQVWRRPVDGSAPPMLVSGPLDVDETVLWFELGPDGAHVVYALDEGADVRLYGRPGDASAPAVQLNDGDLHATSLASNIAISPDGTRVVYREENAFGSNDHGLFSVPIDRSSPPVRLNSASACPEIVNFSISPDSGWVVFRGFEQNGRDCLYSAALDGSAPATPLHGFLPSYVEIAFDGQISPDSTRVLYRADAVVNERFELFSAPIDGSQAPVRIDLPGQPEADVGHWYVGSSPAAQRVVFASDPAIDEAYELFSAPIDGSQPAVRLTAPALTLGNSAAFSELELTPDGSRTVYIHDSSEPQVHEAWSVPSDGSLLPKRLNAPMHNGPVDGDVLAFDHASDGRRIYRARGSGPGLIELYSADPARQPRVVPLELQPGPDYSASSFVMSADRRTVFYRARLADDLDHLFAAPADASTPPVDITPPGGLGIGTFLLASPSGDWVLCERSDGVLARASVKGSFLLSGEPVQSESLIKPDGNRILFRNDPYPSGSSQLFSVHSQGGFATPLHPDLPPDCTVLPGFRITLDGLRVLFVANDGPGQKARLYRVLISGATTPTLLSLPDQNVDASSLRLSPDGLGVAYLANDGSAGEIWGAPINGGPPILLSGPMVSGGNPQVGFEFSHGTPHLVYVADAETNDVFELYSLRVGDAGPVKLSGGLVAGGDVKDFHLSPDGGWVVYRADETFDERIELYTVPVDGSLPALRLDLAQATGDVESDFALTSSLVLFRGNTRNALATELFSVPIAGSSAPRRLNGPLCTNGNVLQFLVAPAGSSVLYRADQEQDEVFELYEATFSRPTRRGELR